MNHIGLHYIWDVSRISPAHISHVEKVEPSMTKLLGTTSLTVLGEPQGVTGIILLSESSLESESSFSTY